MQETSHFFLPFLPSSKSLHESLLELPLGVLDLCWFCMEAFPWLLQRSTINRRQKGPGNAPTPNAPHNVVIVSTGGLYKTVMFLKRTTNQPTNEKKTQPQINKPTKKTPPLNKPLRNSHLPLSP